MSDFDPIEYVTKTYKPGSFISHHPWIDPIAPGTAPFDLDQLVVAGIVKKQRRGYYMASVEELAKRCNERLTKIVQRASGHHELRILLPSAPRAYAFDVVADELAYGDTCLTNPHRSDCSSKSHVEHLALIDHCVAEAKRAYYDEPGEDGVGDEIRTMKALRALLDQAELIRVRSRLDDALGACRAAPSIHERPRQRPDTKTHIHRVEIDLAALTPGLSGAEYQPV